MIYFVRHGETDYNITKRYTGQRDIPLNENGIKEADELKKKLKDIEFDYVFSSPLIRAYRTAQIITDNIIIADNRLMERYNGILEGKHKRDLNMLLRDNETYEGKYGIEPLTDFSKRVYSFIDDIVDLEGNILVVTHAGVCVTARCYFEGIPKDNNYKLYDVENCGYYLVNNLVKKKIKV